MFSAEPGEAVPSSTRVCAVFILHNSLLVLYLAGSLFVTSRIAHLSSASRLVQVLVWHTRTEKPHLANEPKHLKDTVVIEV